MPLTDVRPLMRGLPFGVRVGGVTRADLADAAIREEINTLFEREGMIVFEDVEPSAAMQVAPSEVFGPLKDHPVPAVKRVDAEAMPGVVEIRYPPGSGGIVEIAGEQLSHWPPWHFDHCYTDELNRAGVLRAVAIAGQGGLTGFADGIALYDAFPRELLERDEGKDVVYTLDVQYGTMRFGRPADFRVVRRKPLADAFYEQAAAMPRAIHPAVWTRVDGRKVLHISPWMAKGFLDEEDARPGSRCSSKSARRSSGWPRSAATTIAGVRPTW